MPLLKVSGNANHRPSSSKGLRGKPNSKHFETTQQAIKKLFGTRKSSQKDEVSVKRKRSVTEDDNAVIGKRRRKDPDPPPEHTPEPPLSLLLHDPDGGYHDHISAARLSRSKSCSLTDKGVHEAAVLVGGELLDWFLTSESFIT